MMIVLDTNILVSNFHLSGSIFKVFLEGFYNAGHSLFTLLIVVDETVNKYREELYKLKQSEEKLNNEIHRIIKEKRESTFTEDWIENEVKEYRKHLIKTFKHSAGISARLISYPDVHHKDLVAKALLRKKPFSVKGTGYRDALIWENLLWISETYSGSEKLAFISNNTKDFADNESRLHLDLISDLERKGLDKNSIIFYSSLEDFVKEQISTKYEALNQLKEQLNKNVYEDLDFKQSLLITLNEDLSYITRISNQKNFTSDLPFEYEELEVKSIEDIISYHVTDARRPNSMTEAKVLLNVEINARCQLSAYLHKSSLNNLQDISLFSINEFDSNLSIISFKSIIQFSINSFFNEILDETERIYLFGTSINISDIKMDNSAKGN